MQRPPCSAHGRLGARRPALEHTLLAPRCREDGTGEQVLVEVRRDVDVCMPDQLIPVLSRQPSLMSYVLSGRARGT